MLDWTYDSSVDTIMYNKKMQERRSEATTKNRIKNSDISTCNNDLVLAYAFSKDFKIINNCDETKDLVKF